MLYDSIQNAGLYAGIPGMAQALGYLQSLAPGQQPAGRVELAGGRIFANPVSLVTKPVEECKYEAHRRYIDVHFIVEGVEGISVRQVAGLSPLGAFDEAADIGFYAGQARATCYLHPGEFMVCWPCDAHRVCMMEHAPGPVKKVVVKVPVDF